LTGTKLGIAPARRARAGFRKISKKISCISRSRRARAGLTVYPPRIQIRDLAAQLAQLAGLYNYVMTKSEF
jgi:hypothetical protein